MSLSPRQIEAYLELSVKLDRAERITALADTRVATWGDEKTVRKHLKDLGDHG